MAAKMVTITQKEYDRLLAVDAHMDELDARGVDNWGGYVGSMQDCDSCDAELTWGYAECPKCGASLEGEYY